MRYHNSDLSHVPLAYPETLIRVENKTIYTKMVAVTERALPAIEEKNPAPGVCLPIIVAFCKYHKVRYFHPPSIVHVPSVDLLRNNFR